MSKASTSSQPTRLA